MFEKRSVRWFLILVAILAVGQGVGWLLVGQHARVAGQWVILLDLFAAYAWICRGAWVWRDKPWVRRVGAAFAVTGVVLTSSFLLWRYAHAPSTAIGLTGVWLMLASFLAGLAFIRLLLMPGHPVLGVARTLIDEAIRMKVALIFIIGLALLIPVLPLVLDPTERIQYRMQFLLNWSLTGTALLLSLLTIFLACGTICGEIKNGQIYLTMTKPVGRLQYLVGKLLGIALLDLLLLSVSGVGIYVGARMLAMGPDRGETDRLALFSEVLAAREAVSPSQPNPKAYEEAFAAKLAELRRALPNPGKGAASPQEFEAVTGDLRRRWYSIAPGNMHAYVYSGLSEVKKLAPVVQLRIKAVLSPDPPDKRIPIYLWLND
ncbi:MAG: hypothetical protein NTW19_24260, partial [Planctomycetota bacterium]|nr:hypothetical protein [Planctomycetota bacterium]